MALTREQLDVAECGVPSCTHDHSVLFFHGKCHGNADVDVQYTKATGVLTITCNRCHGHVIDIQVASLHPIPLVPEHEHQRYPLCNNRRALSLARQRRESARQWRANSGKMRASP
jgi:hypothetical protein